MPEQDFETVILGAGPGGTGPLISALQDGRLSEWLARGVAVVDRGGTMGPGVLGRYALNADTPTGTFLECLDAPAAAQVLSGVSRLPLTRRLQRLRQQHLPLPLLAQYLEALGAALQAHVAQQRRCRFYAHTRARGVRLGADGRLRVALRRPGGMDEEEISARSVILALGGWQPRGAALAAEIAPGVALRDGWADRTLLSDEVLTEPGLQRARLVLAGAGSGSGAGASADVVVLGGAHSGWSVAWALLRVGAQRVWILHRDPVRVTYLSVAAAQADGYTGFDERDVCPRTGRVHRLGGLRGDGRQLYREVVGLGGPPREPRVVPLRLEGMSPAEVRRWLDRAALIVPALGYVARSVPIWIQDRVVCGPAPAHRVDRRCRVELPAGVSAPLFGIGLSSGFVPHGAMGGEPSFTGQTNGAWLYQNDIGRLIVDQILS